MKKWVVTDDPMDIKRIIRKCCEQLCLEIELRKMEQFHYLLKVKGCCLVAQSWLTLQPHGVQHTRLPCPSPSPKVCPSTCPWHR